MHPNIERNKTIPLLCSVILAFFLISTFAGPVSAGKLDDDYFSALRAYNKLLKSPKQKKYRQPWVDIINKFQKVYKRSPKERWADNALFRLGRAYRELYRYSGRKSDIKKSIEHYNRMIKLFPTSVLADDALFDLAEIALNVQKERDLALKHYKRIVTRYPKSDHRAKAKVAISKFSPPKSKYKKNNYKKPEQDTSLINVKQLRFWSNPTYTRVVIDAADEVSYSYRLLKKDPSIHKPQRLYIDLNQTKIGRELSTVVPIRDDLLKEARVAQNTPTSVRIVLDINTIDTFKIFSLHNPFRIVVDVNGKGTITAQKTAPLPSRALAKQLALHVKRIVIDPGHGGKDCGAPGYYKGVFEKDITLRVAKKLGERIKKELGCEVFYTRTSDKFLPLEERTAIANTKNADLFISIHANATEKRYTYGIETYFLNLATDNDAIMVAARENATSAKSISDLEIILNDLMRYSKINESSHLAACVQNGLIKDLQPKYSKIKDLGVKQAPFYVLLGAKMPSILVELGFISHKTECKRLTNFKYQDRLVSGIIKGVKRYIKEIKPSVMMADTYPQVGG